jgi:hypothetical protein
MAITIASPSETFPALATRLMSKTRNPVNSSADTAEIAVHRTPDWMKRPTSDATTTTTSPMEQEAAKAAQVAVGEVPDAARRDPGHRRRRRGLEDDQARALGDVDLQHVAEDNSLEGAEQDEQHHVDRRRVAREAEGDEDAERARIPGGLSCVVLERHRHQVWHRKSVRNEEAVGRKASVGWIQ